MADDNIDLVKFFSQFGPENLCWYRYISDDVYLNVPAQFDVIRELIGQLKTQEDIEYEEIKAAESDIQNAYKQDHEYAEGFANEEHRGLLELSLYRDASRSMAIVAMIAPFLEGVFRHYFMSIGKFMAPHVPTPDSRLESAHAMVWNCELVMEKGSWRKDITKGVQQIATECGLAKNLPGEFLDDFAAIVAYRNKMFHHGMEWPITERQKFLKRWPTPSKQKSASKRFQVSPQDGEPCIIYLDNDFVEKFLSKIEQALKNMMKFAKDHKPHDETKVPDKYMKKLLESQ